MKRIDQNHSASGKSGLPYWLSGKESACQSSKSKLHPWVRKILWRRKWQPTPGILLLGEPHGAWRTIAHGVAKNQTRHSNWIANNSSGNLGLEMRFPKVFFFFFFSWRLITLQYCTGFCHTLKWFSHGFTCTPHLDPPSHLPLHPIPLGLPSAPGPSTCLMHPTRAGDLSHPR